MTLINFYFLLIVIDIYIYDFFYRTFNRYRQAMKDIDSERNHLLGFGQVLFRKEDFAVLADLQNRRHL